MNYSLHSLALTQVPAEAYLALRAKSQGRASALAEYFVLMSRWVRRFGGTCPEAFETAIATMEACIVGVDMSAPISIRNPDTFETSIYPDRHSFESSGFYAFSRINSQ